MHQSFEWSKSNHIWVLDATLTRYGEVHFRAMSVPYTSDDSKPLGYRGLLLLNRLSLRLHGR